jgi:hypothetical protein
VVGQVTFSKPFGFLDRGCDDGSFAQIDIALKSAAWVGQIPWLYWLHDRLMPVIGNWIGANARHGGVRSFAAKEVEKRKGRGSEHDHRDILELLQAVQKDKPTEMNDMAVLSMTTSNIFAGSDTTAISIGAVLYHLCKNPRPMQRLKDEVDSMSSKVGKEAETWPLAVAERMPYLQACIYEALRLHPAVGMNLPRTTPQGGIEIDGNYIPGSVCKTLAYGHMLTKMLGYRGHKSMGDTSQSRSFRGRCGCLQTRTVARRGSRTTRCVYSSVHRTHHTNRSQSVSSLRLGQAHEHA